MAAIAGGTGWSNNQGYAASQAGPPPVPTASMAGSGPRGGAGVVGVVGVQDSGRMSGLKRPASAVGRTTEQEPPLQARR